MVGEDPGVGVHGAQGKSPRKPLRLSLGWGSVLFVVYLGARPGQRCLLGKGVGGGDAGRNGLCTARRDRRYSSVIHP